MSEEEAKKIIDTIKQEEFPYALAIAKAYEKLEQENKELSKKILDNTTVNITLKRDRDYWQNIVNELEKWLKEGIKYDGTHYEREKSVGYTLVLDKLQKLKEETK